MRWLLASVEQGLDDFVRLSDIDGVNTNAFIMFDQTFEGFSSIVRAHKALNFRFSSVVPSHKVEQKRVYLDCVDCKRIAVQWCRGNIVLQGLKGYSTTVTTVRQGPVPRARDNTVGRSREDLPAYEYGHREILDPNGRRPILELADNLEWEDDTHSSHLSKRIDCALPPQLVNF